MPFHWGLVTIGESDASKAAKWGGEFPQNVLGKDNVLCHNEWCRSRIHILHPICTYATEAPIGGVIGNIDINTKAGGGNMIITEICAR